MIVRGRGRTRAGASGHVVILLCIICDISFGHACLGSLVHSLLGVSGVVAQVQGVAAVVLRAGCFADRLLEACNGGWDEWRVSVPSHIEVGVFFFFLGGCLFVWFALFLWLLLFLLLLLLFCCFVVVVLSAESPYESSIMDLKTRAFQLSLCLAVTLGLVFLSSCPVFFLCLSCFPSCPAFLASLPVLLSSCLDWLPFFRPLFSR